MSIQSNRVVALKISDPWDLGESLGWKSYTAQVLAEDEEKVLIRLDEPFTYKGKQREYFVASARHQGDSVAQLAKGKPLFSTMSQIDSDGINHDDLLNEERWQAGIGLIGELDPIATV
ncbi:MAG: hypothetical protein AAGA96_04150 [Verrucomicrobiota bacterium]